MIWQIKRDTLSVLYQAHPSCNRSNASCTSDVNLEDASVRQVALLVLESRVTLAMSSQVCAIQCCAERLAMQTQPSYLFHLWSLQRTSAVGH